MTTDGKDTRKEVRAASANRVVPGGFVAQLVFTFVTVSWGASRHTMVSGLHFFVVRCNASYGPCLPQGVDTNPKRERGERW